LGNSVYSSCRQKPHREYFDSKDIGSFGYSWSSQTLTADETGAFELIFQLPCRASAVSAYQAAWHNRDLIAMQNISKIIRLPATSQKTGLSRSTIYALIARGEFPKQIKLSPRSIGFLESEVDQWLADRASARTAPVSAQ
jgi:prophage regulatory protein